MMLMLAYIQVFADNSQTVKGKILDAQSQFPISFATVVVVDSDPIIGTTSDDQGNFRLENVPVGRQTFRFSFVGYEEEIVQNVLVSSGKEVILKIEMEESVQMMKDIVVKASEQKGAMVNDMATVSARGFNLEETQRYAGSRNDPARMAANFAGVSGANDGRNDIIIRGNSPTGLLWRLEGLDIPNPNHFAALGTTGGPVSILNNNLLSDSEFYTGAFPSMYGNAISGVFDLKMRNGNNENTEFLGQIGFNGIELGAEGPFSKNSESSYLINYRYSVPAIFQELGLNAGTGAAVPYYQDLSFKLNFPFKKGRLSMFGIGGLSHIDLLGSETTAEEAESDLYGDLDLDIYNFANTGVTGISYLHFLDKNTFWKNSIAVSGTSNGARVDTVMRDESLEIQDVREYVDNDFTQIKYTYQSTINKKFNARNTVTAGLIAELFDMNLLRKTTWQGEEDLFINEVDFSGNTSLWQGYLAWQHKFNPQWTLNAGLHYQQLALNDESKALEPRIGLKYQFLPQQSLSLAYGRHNQMQGLQIYFVETDLDQSKVRTNENLGFTTSDHFVLAYDWQIKPDLRLKLETYYQNIFNVPVTRHPSAFSMLNAGADFGLPDEDSLVNQGTGYNQGIELTLEKFFNNSYYFLITGSLFDSKYTGSDGVERNTVFNGNYVVNGLIGKEWNVGKKNNQIAADIKFTTAGNRRYIPIDLEASREKGYAVYNRDQSYEDRYKDYLRADVKLTFRLQHKKITEEYVLDIQNVTNNQNIFMQRYNSHTGTIGTTNQLGIWPMFQYRILF